MIATVILLVGMVGVFQGMLIASVQNSMANRRTRAAGIAAELMSALQQQGYARVTALACDGTMPSDLGPTGSTLPYTPNKLKTVPSALSNFTRCFIDVEAGGTNGAHER